MIRSEELHLVIMEDGIAYGMSLFGRVTQITEKAYPKVTNLTATVFGANQVDLSWTAPPGVTVTGYEIERSENGRKQL